MPPTLRRLTMRLVSFTTLVFVIWIFSISTLGQSRGGKATAPAPRNAQIVRIVAEINPKNIEATIRKLVSFGTRNTLSEQDNPNRGIGAAHDWLYSEFQKARPSPKDA
jgi:hypothetical protein